MLTTPNFPLNNVIRRGGDEADYVRELYAYDVLIGYTYGSLVRLNGDFEFELDEKDLATSLQVAYIGYARQVEQRTRLIAALEAKRDTVSQPNLYNLEIEIARLRLGADAAGRHIKHINSIETEHRLAEKSR